MKIKVRIFIILFIVFVSIDQLIKFGFVNFPWDAHGDIVSFKLIYNRGVAFSMFEFLGAYLKYIQILVLLGLIFYLIKNKEFINKYYLPLSFILAGGVSNILDRFTYGAVVDYIYWHYLFEFAIFNFADILINIGVLIIIYMQFFQKKYINNKRD